MADEREIVLSERNDIENINLNDYVPEALIKVYPYRAIFGRKDKNWLQSNTNTIVRISQQEKIDTSVVGDTIDTIISDFENLKSDEEGNAYFEAFVAVDAMTKETISPSSSSYEKDIRKIKQLTMLVNKYIDSEDDRPDFFTIKKPFDEQDFKNGNQTIYYGASFTKAYSTDVEALLDEGFDIDVEKDTVSEITLYDISELEKELDKSKLYFTQNNALFEKPKVTYTDSDGKTVTKNGVKLKLDIQTLLESIDGKGLLEIKNIGNGQTTTATTDVDFITGEAVMPFKMKPINSIEKVTMAAEWFDYDKVLPYFIATQFEGEGTQIQDLILNPNEDKNEQTETITPDKSNIDKKWEKDGKAEINMLKTQGKNIYHFKAYFEGDEKTPFLESSNRLLTKSINDYKSPNGNSFSYTFDITNGKLSIINNGKDINVESKNIIIKYIRELDMELILPREDVNLIEDILVLSLAQHDSFNKAPVLKSGGDAGKINPDYRLGHRGIKVQTIKGQNIGNIIDGWFLEHQVNYPGFRRKKQRYQTVKALVNALSKYIISQANSTGGGSNELNSITLPWFLEITENENNKNVLGYENEVTILNPEPNQKDSDGKEIKTVKTYVLPGISYNDDTNLIESNSNLIWTLRTNFFKTNYSSTLDYDSRPNLILPKEVDLSNVKMYQTDRKVIFPKMGSVLKSFDLNSLPGDIKGADKDFSYIYHLPINNTSDFSKIFLDEVNSSISYKKGDTIPAQVARTDDGILETTEYAKQKIIKKYGNVKFIQEPTAIKVDGIIGQMENAGHGDGKQFSVFSHYHTRWWPVKLNTGQTKTLYNNEDFFESDRELGIYDIWQINSEERFQKIVSSMIGVVPDAIKLISKLSDFGNVQDEYDGWNIGSLRYNIQHTEFVEATIEFTEDTVISNSGNTFNARQMLFDKAQWTKFISQYTNKLLDTVEYHLIESTNNEIEILEELSISSLWGNEMVLSADGIPGITIRLNNQDDETLTTQKIILY